MTSPSIGEMETAVEALAAFVIGTRFADLPAAVVAKAKTHLLDTLGAALSGAQSVEATMVLATLTATEARGSAAVWGTTVSLAPRSAALVNGVAVHAFEVDDTGGCDHSGAVVVPASLAAVAASPSVISGTDLIAAIVIGYDIARRVLEAFGGYEPHNEAGWHSTGTFGTFGAAAAAARLLQLDCDKTASALGLAASFSGGLWAFIHDGAMSKRVHAGRAAEGGLTAAMLAGHGVSGPRYVLADRWGGFLRTYARDAADERALTVALGERWRISRCSIKPYASCRGTHATVDAVAQILAETGITAPDVAAVNVRVSAFLYGMCGRRDTESLAAAQMSLPYAVAARIVLGTAGLSAYDECCRRDSRLLAMLERVSLEIDPEMGPEEQPHVTLTARDGSEHATWVTDPSGSPTNPLNDSELLAKFHDLATRVISARQATMLADAVQHLEEMTDVRSLLRLLRRPSDGRAI